MVNKKQAAEQQTSPEQQVQDTPVQDNQQDDPIQQQAVAMRTMALNTTPSVVNETNPVIDNYKEIKSALTGPTPSWKLPALNLSAVATNPTLSPENLKN